MAYKMNGVVVFIFIEFLFKRKNDIHFIYIPLNVFDASFLPRPYLRRDVIMGPKTLFFSPFCNAEIKARIIDENYGIGMKRFDIILDRKSTRLNSSHVR